MSEMYFKAALRAPLPQLKECTASEIHKFYLDTIGPADDLDLDEESNHLYLWYNPKNHRYCAIRSMSGEWGVEQVIQECPDYEAKPVNLSLDELTKLSKQMAKTFGINKNSVKITAYSWYTGVDEPVTF